LSGFHSLEIEHTEDKPGMEALYLAGWLSAPYHAQVTFRKAAGYGPGIQRISFRSDTAVIEFERTSAECVTLWTSTGRERKYSFADASITALMTEELSVAGFDPAFNTALDQARELLQ
jgi:hypothetical protein